MFEYTGDKQTQH